MTYQVHVERAEIPYTAELHDGVVRLFTRGRFVGEGIWCLGRIMRLPDTNALLGIPRIVADALELELCDAIAATRKAA